MADKQRVKEKNKLSRNERNKRNETAGFFILFFIAYLISKTFSVGFAWTLLTVFASYWIVKKIVQLFLKEKKETLSESSQEKEKNQAEIKPLENNNKKKKKRLFFWLIIAGLVLVLIVFVARSVWEEQSFKTVPTDKSEIYSEVQGNLYRNIKYNFRIKFPEGWEIQAGDGPNILQKAVKGNNSISVQVREIPLGVVGSSSTIKDIITLDEFKNGIMENFKEAEPIDYGETQLDNKPAYWIKFSQSYSVLNTTVRGTLIQYQLLNDNIFYLISAGSTSDEFKNVEAEFLKSISTFVIENY